MHFSKDYFFYVQVLKMTKDLFCRELLRFLPCHSDVEHLRSLFIVNCILNGILSYSTAVLNCLAIHAVKKTSFLSASLKTILLSLAISDLGIGLFSQPFFVVLLSKSLRNDNLGCTTYTIFTFVIIFFTSASLFGVMAISLDRYMAIYLHLRYQELVTQTRVVAGVASLWILSAILSLIFLWIDPNVFALTFSITAAVCLAVTSLLYFKIYIIVRRHNFQIRRQNQIQQDAPNDDEISFASRKYAVGTFYVYAVFLVCYLPHAFSLLAIVIGIGPHIIMKGLYNISLTITFLNSTLNPVVYCWKMRHIRRAMVETLRNIFRRGRNHRE